MGTRGTRARRDQPSGADDVDLEATTDTGGGFNLMKTRAGEWLKYSVNVTTATGHEPPATVADSEAPTPGDTGEASLSESAGTRTLVVNATNDFGETIQLTASCAP